MKVLIAEDNQTIVEGYKKIFPAFNIEIVDTAENGLEVVEKYRLHSKQIDLVLCDNKMPYMTGLEAARHILSFDPKAIIVIVSGDPLTESAYKNIGVHAAIKKPFEIELLVRIINTIVGKTGLKSEAFDE